MFFGDKIGIDSSLLGDAGDGQNIYEETGKNNNTGFDNSSGNDNSGKSGENGDLKETNQPDSDAYIHVVGAVKKPGVYVFKKTPRICDVIKAAGGFKKNASTVSINLAQSIEDGSQLSVETKKQYNKRQRQIRETAENSTGSSDAEGSKVNINEAGADQLMTLPGIGESKAQAIISYREDSGKFNKVEDLMNISGIKNGVFDKIKERIVV